MLTTLRRSPIRRKRSKPRKGPPRDKKYLAWIRTQRCAIRGCVACFYTVEKCEAAHVGLRGLGQKCSDYETIPLCIWHHREGPYSHHQLQKNFWLIHNLDRDKLIEQYNARFVAEFGHTENNAG